MSNKASTPINIPYGSDLNNYTVAGMYYTGTGGSTITNVPPGMGSFSLFVERNDAYGDGVKQTITGNTGDTFTRVYRYSGANTWSPWKQLATTEPPQMFDLPLTAEVTEYNDCTYYKNAVGEVHFYLSIKMKTGYFTHTMPVANFPEGFKPSKDTRYPAAYIGSEEVANSIVVDTGGGLTARTGSHVQLNVLFCTGTFLATQ